MLNVCPHCGHYEVDRQQLAEGLFSCQQCLAAIPIRQMPLFVVGGPSGSGKSTLCQLAIGRMLPVVMLDMDILWNDYFNEPESGYRSFFETWLRMAKNIGASGRPVVLFGAGACVPENIEPCLERRYFTEIYYLAITCDDDEIRQRLLARPAWRGCHDEAFIKSQLTFNQTLKDRADAPGPYSFECLDTGTVSAETSVVQLEAWLGRHLNVP